jgi:phage terminase large subunit
MTPIERYATLGIRAGCPRDQVHNFAKAGVILQERQLAASAAARLCDASDGPTEIGYGGARGGGKSHWLLAQIGADDCQRLSGIKCLLLRKVGKANLEHFEDLRQALFSRLSHEMASSRGILTFANGSRIVAGHFQCESDIDSYLGLEYDVVAVEEATTLSRRKYEQILTCCRSSKQFRTGNPWRPRVYSTTNPGGIGHAWYRARFITPYAEQRESGTRFIPARVTDNAFNNPEYRKVLENLSGWQRRAWLDGDWDIQAGQFFTNFRRESHVITDFDETRAREWWAALDYGFTHYTVFLLGCRDCDGNIFIVDEHAQRLWLPERHAAAIRGMLARHNLTFGRLRKCVAGSDVFSRQSDGSTVAQQYAGLGMSLRPANMDRINGWAEILSRLGDPGYGISARLFIHARCGRLVETLASLQHDPMRPEDVLKTDIDDEGAGGDDAADALRYLLASKPQIIGCAVA